jgi:uncharacterized membrane protein
MGLRASIAKHPIHPMIIPLPIGLWVFTLACQVISAAGGAGAWEIVATYTMAGGVIGALLSITPGFIDLFSIPPSRARTDGIWHMSLNISITALFIINIALRATGSVTTTASLILSIIGIALLLVSGWLGGSMVYVHGVAVEPQRVAAEPPHREEPVEVNR